PLVFESVLTPETISVQPEVVTPQTPHVVSSGIAVPEDRPATADSEAAHLRPKTGENADSKLRPCPRGKLVQQTRSNRTVMSVSLSLEAESSGRMTEPLSGSGSGRRRRPPALDSDVAPPTPGATGPGRLGVFRRENSPLSEPDCRPRSSPSSWQDFSFSPEVRSACAPGSPYVHSSKLDRFRPRPGQTQQIRARRLMSPAARSPSGQAPALPAPIAVRVRVLGSKGVEKFAYNVRSDEVESEADLIARVEDRLITTWGWTAVSREEYSQYVRLVQADGTPIVHGVDQEHNGGVVQEDEEPESTATGAAEGGRTNIDSTTGAAGSMLSTASAKLEAYFAARALYHQHQYHQAFSAEMAGSGASGSGCFALPIWPGEEVPASVTSSDNEQCLPMQRVLSRESTTTDADFQSAASRQSTPSSDHSFASLYSVRAAAASPIPDTAGISHMMPSGDQL
ncbi:unnamed protein product, partial [Amoebophrya sp. A25]